MMAFNSYVAACARSPSSAAQGEGASHVCATDPGSGNADGQIAGSLVMGCFALFLQECTAGRPHRAGELPRSTDADGAMPKVESIIMPSGGFWGGVYEPMIWSRRPRSSTRSSPRRASASARSRWKHQPHHVV
jgi:isoquinoline 1-oxidoreductase beta subunit